MARCAACSAEWAFIEALAAAAPELSTAPAPEGLLGRPRSGAVAAARRIDARRPPWRLVLVTALVGVGGVGSIAVAPAVRELATVYAVPTPPADVEQAYRDYCSRPLPKPNAFDRYIAAGAQIDPSSLQEAPLPHGSDHVFGATATAETVDAMDKIVTSHAGALAAVDSARTLGCARPPSDYAQGASSGTRLRFRRRAGSAAGNQAIPSAARLAALADLLHVRGDLALSRKDYVECAETGLDLVTLGRFARPLSRPAGNVTDGFRLVGGAVDRLEPGDLARLERRVARMMRAWPAASEAVFEWRRERGAVQSPIGFMPGGSPFSQWVLNRERMQQLETSYLDAAYRAYSAPATDRRIPITFQRPTVLQRLDELVDGAVERSDTGRARIECLYAALKVRAFRLRHGKLPSSLKEAGIAAKDLIDPFTGKPLGYAKEADRFVVYSVGQDRRDDMSAKGDLRGHGDIMVVPEASDSKRRGLEWFSGATRRDAAKPDTKAEEGR